DLHARHAGAGDGVQRLIHRFDADAVRGDALLVYESVECLEYLVAAIDGRRRAMQLDEVQGLDAQIAARAVGPGAEVVEGVVLRPLLDAPAHLGGDGQGVSGVGALPLADQLLAAAVAVAVGRVAEGDARLGSRVEDGECRRLVDVSPVGTELPGAEAYDGYGSAGAAENAFLHTPDLTGRVGAAYSLRGTRRATPAALCPRRAPRAPVRPQPGRCPRAS